jgi:hypothetical protein
MWPTIPLVMVGYLLPWVGGLGFVVNAFWSYYLINQIWFNKISFVSKDEIFVVHNDVYNLFYTHLSFSGTMLLIGIIFLFVGLAELIKSGHWQMNPLK